MSSELHKYIETAIERKKNLFNADVISFPNEKKINNSNNFQVQHKSNVWKISDKSNIDQLRAVVGVCFMFIALIVMGLYSNFI